MKRSVIVHSGRASARGEIARVRGWRDVLAAGGWTIDEVALAELRPTFGGALQRFPEIATGRVPAEVLGWCPNQLAGRLDSIEPELIVCVSTRSWHASMRDRARHVVLDIVDPLAPNYLQRSRVATPMRSLALRTLAVQHRRVEQRLDLLPSNVRCVCIGFGDAEQMGVEWFPATIAELPEVIDTSQADHDAVFVGSLRYEPNVDALRFLASEWPTSRSLLVAGADPSPEVRRIVETRNWTLAADFANLDDVLRRARLAVAPLRIGTGLQYKVLDAAARAMPQVVSTRAAAGFPPNHIDRVPLDSFIAEACRLLDAPVIAAQTALAARESVEQTHLVMSGVRRLEQILSATSA
jgi:hypothetical protein